ncbi:MAG: hypothetical protein ACJ74J_05840 [Blastocatellia bacterium]
MRNLKKTLALAAICGVLWVFPLAFAQEAQQPGETSVSLLKVGLVDVTQRERIILEQPTTDLFGHAWNYQNKEFYGLLKFTGGRQWYVAASSKSEPGGVFHIEGVRFPEAGDFDLMVVLGEPGSLSAGSWIEELQWRDHALALSQRVSVTVERPPNIEGDSSAGEPYVAVLSVANVSLSLREISTVPASGDVTLKARGLPNASFYIALHAPYTDLCYMIGPGKKGTLPDHYVLHSVSFEIPGDPQQIDFDLIAFAAATPVQTGPKSWQSFRWADLVTSPTMGVRVEGRNPRSDSLRIPFIAITGIGSHPINARQPASRRVDVEQGDRLEVSSYERAAEGARLWALTRPKGSSIWLAQGPLIPCGGASAEAPDGHPPVAWVLPSLRFEHPDKKGAQGGEFEVMAVLSNAIFPNSWISSVSLSAQTIETISQAVPANVNGATTPSEIRLTITHIGSQEADTESEMTVGSTESVIIDEPEDFPKALKVYVAEHVNGATTWSFVEAIPNDKTHFVPALSFSNPHTEEGTRYQVVAIATQGPLPMREAEYQDFLPHIVAASDLINVRYSRAAGRGFLGWLASPIDQPDTQEVLTNMRWILLLVVVLLLIFVALTWLTLRPNPALAGEIADTLQRGHAAAKKRFELPERVNPAYFALGLILLGVVFYIIKNYYISLYTMIVANVTGLPKKTSAELALWLILITALAGIFADIAHKLSKQPQAEPVADDGLGKPGRSANKRSPLTIYQYVFAFSMLIAIILWLCQGAIYSIFFQQTTTKNSLGLSTIGLGAGILISMTETITFFLITELSLVPTVWLFLMIMLAPLYLLSLLFRFIQRVFEGRRRPESPPAEPPPPEPDETHPDPPLVAAPVKAKEV